MAASWCSFVLYTMPTMYVNTTTTSLANLEALRRLPEVVTRVLSRITPGFAVM